MPYKLYDYADHRGNRIAEWGKGQPRIQLAKLNSKLDTLMTAEPDLVHGLLYGVSGFPQLRKIKIQGNPKLRPLLCKGPLDNDAEFTLLVGAREIEFGWDPVAARETAKDRRQEIISTGNRRCEHERFKDGTA